MSKKNKLHHFAENASFDNMFQLNYEQLVNGFELQGNWNRSFFKNLNDNVIELGCGKGEYTVGLAQLFPDRNFIGVDIKGARIWRGLVTADERKLKKVA